MVGWLQQLWDTITAVSVPLLVLGVSFQTAQTLFVALAWRNILRAAYPEAGVTYRPIMRYYAGGVGLNAILPASAGTVAMLGFFRSSIAGSTVAGLVGATVVENIFFVFVSILVYGWLFFGVAGSFDVHFGWFSDHPVASAVILVGGAILIFIAGRILYRRFKTTWENAKEGGAILADRRRFLVEVVGVVRRPDGRERHVHAGVPRAGVGHQRLPDRRRIVDLLDRRRPPGRRGGADRPRLGRPARRRAAERDHGLHRRPGAHHDGLERGVRTGRPRAPDRLGPDACAHPPQAQGGRGEGRRAGGRRRRRHARAR